MHCDNSIAMLFLQQVHHQPGEWKGNNEPAAMAQQHRAMAMAMALWCSGGWFALTVVMK